MSHLIPIAIAVVAGLLMTRVWRGRSGLHFAARRGGGRRYVSGCPGLHRFLHRQRVPSA